MNNADLYHKANEFQRRDAEEVIRDNFQLINWKEEGRDRILDIGCGDGQIMVDVLMPHLPQSYEKIVGVDISAKMISYASFLYKNPKIDFQIMDISQKNGEESSRLYDHIFSFNCLHWVQDQSTAMSNIYNMLTDGGDCLITYIAKNLIFEVYKILGKNPKWEAYMWDLKKYISPFHESSNPGTEVKNLLHATGFKHVRVEYKQKTFYFNSLKNLKHSAFAVNPFLERIPSYLHDEYFEDYVKIVRDFDLIEGDNNNLDEQIKIKSPYSSLIVYAIK